MSHHLGAGVILCPSPPQITRYTSIYRGLNPYLSLIRNFRYRSQSTPCLPHAYAACASPSTTTQKLSSLLSLSVPVRTGANVLWLGGRSPNRARRTSKATLRVTLLNHLWRGRVYSTSEVTSKPRTAQHGTISSTALKKIRSRFADHLTPKNGESLQPPERQEFSQESHKVWN